MVRLCSKGYEIWLYVYVCVLLLRILHWPCPRSILAVPIIGMILGNAISAIGISCNAIQKEFAENRDKIETYLSFGATRFEACRPIGREALKLALLPTVNQMSVIGLISIPGMMTGAIIGGSSVQQAARLQMIIMFSECPRRSEKHFPFAPVDHHTRVSD